MASSDLTTSTRPAPDPAARPRGASFPGASVVQLVAGHPGEPTAAVVELHPATVTVTDRAVTAREGELSWSWPHRDVVQVHHGSGARWSLLVVPGVAHHGVAVAAEDVDAFRAALDRHRPGSAPAPVASPAPELTFEPIPPRPVPSPAPARTAPPSADLTISPPAALAEPAPEPAWPTPPPMPAPAEPAVSEAEQVQDPGPDVIVPAPVTEVIPTVVPGSVGPAPQGLAGLEARDISAWFGTHQVLDRVSLEMAAGEVTALIGPSGCGKSTFLRILNRMHELVPSAALAGEVLLDGTDIYDPSRKLTDARRQIGMVFQKPNPFPAMSIYDNVVASLKLTGTKAGADVKDHLVETCLTKAGLWTEVRDRLRQPGGGLSGGQQQRLCIARALAIRPRVLLMDEPCSALDPTSTRRIEQTITELADEVTIVIVTHNMQQAARVSDRCAFFLAEHGTPGYIVEHGPTEAMFHAPQDPRTSDYVNGRFG